MKKSKLVLLITLVIGFLLPNTQFGQSMPLREASCTPETVAEYELTQLKQGRQLYGHCVRIPLTVGSLSLAYFVKESATQPSPYAQCLEVIGKEDLILVSSAGFAVHDDGRPLGLSLAGGTVMNYRLSSEMDGVAVIDQGAISVYDREKSMYIEGLGSGRLSDVAYKTRFVNWAKAKQLSVFQAHLLAYNDELTVPVSGRLKPAFRKMLAQGRSQSGEVSLFIFYIQQGVFLYDASKTIFDHLKRKLYAVDFMINLDTGAHDVFQLQDGTGTCMGQEVSGFSNVFSSSNLLVIYRP